jgi:hypothetical protein
MSDNSLYRGPMRDNAYKSLVAMHTRVHNVLVVGNCDMWQVLCHIQNLRWLILLLYKLRSHLAVGCTVVPGYTVQNCTGDVLGCTAAARYCKVAA